MSSVKLNSKGLSMTLTSEARASRIGVTVGACAGILLIAGASFVGCQTGKTNQPDTEIICSVFEPISWEDGDTVKTKEQIVVFNRMWDFYCTDKAVNLNYVADSDKIVVTNDKS